MFDILSGIPGKKRTTQNGWHSFNAVCCHHRGHSPDKRSRGGIKFDGEHNWSYHCFNCHFKCGFRLGKPISKNTRMLLNWLGIEQDEIFKLNLESLKYKDIIDYATPKKKRSRINFKEMELPEDAELISVDSPEHKIYVEYLASRGFTPKHYPFMITPSAEGRLSNRIIIPYTFNEKVVGHISRYLDNRIPKYIKEQQTGYVFGIDLQKPEWESCIVTEGPFDALSIDGCALTHDTISAEQAEVLKSLNKRIVIVPDQDKTGLKICDRALELGFYVSIPDWGSDVKDVNDAVLKFGKLPTLLSILQHATNSKIKIEIQRRKIVKRV